MVEANVVYVNHKKHINHKRVHHVFVMVHMNHKIHMVGANVVYVNHKKHINHKRVHHVFLWFT